MPTENITKDGASRVVELKSAMAGKLEENDRIAAAFTIEDNGVVVTAEQRDAFRSNLRDIEEIKSLIGDLEAQENARNYGSEISGKSVALAAEAMHQQTGDARPSGFAPMQHKSLGEMFTSSEEFKSLLKSGAATMPSPWEVETSNIGEMGVKDVYTAAAPTTTNLGFGTVQRDPFIERSMRTARVRDLFTVARTSANLIDFYRVTGFTEGNPSGGIGNDGAAAPVAERDGGAFGLKPQSTLNFALGQAPVRTIAHFEVAHRNVLADEPQLQSVINNELLYGLRLEEDDQILNGDGTGENLLGILNQAGLQVYNKGTSDPGETSLDALRRASTRVMLAYYGPTGYVLHPFDWEAIELSKDTQDRYLLVTNVAIGAQSRVWRQPVVESPAMPQGEYITGAWGLGAQLYDREQGNIRIAEQHSDFFIRNAVAILAEERLAFAVKRPESFVKGTI